MSPTCVNAGGIHLKDRLFIYLISINRDSDILTLPDHAAFVHYSTSSQSAHTGFPFSDLVGPSPAGKIVTHNYSGPCFIFFIHGSAFLE